MHRRNLLAALAGAPLLSFSRAGAAQALFSRLKSLVRDSSGTTLVLSLDQAPFPATGPGYRDDTVFFFVPAHYRFRDEEGVAALVHFHGHNTTAERSLTAHE